MALRELKADAKLHRERLLKVDLSELDQEKLVDFIRGELAGNIWPWLEAFCGEADDELSDLGEAVDTLIDQSESLLHPEVAAQIVTVFELGKLVCDGAEPLVAQMPDELARRKMQETIKAFRKQAEVVTDVVGEITTEVSLDDGDGGDGDEDDDGATPDVDDADIVDGSADDDTEAEG